MANADFAPESRKKNVSCAYLSREQCAAVFTARSCEGMVKRFWDHVMLDSAHPELAKRLKKLQQASHERWLNRMEEAWEAAPWGS